MTKILVVGCSFTRGHGLPQEHLDPQLWVNQFCKHFPQPNIDNRAQRGRDNSWIFLEASTAIAQNDYDIVLVSWTELSRMNYTVGLELYPTYTMFHNMSVDVNPGQHVSAEWLVETGDRLRRHYNDHWSCLNIVKYVNILYDQQVRQRGKQLLFVNAALPWSDNYFVPFDWDTPSQLSPFVQDILQSSTRDDTEVRALYQMIHEQYQHYGGIHPECWLNLYRPYWGMKIDVLPTYTGHPGIKSNKLFAEYLKQQYETMHNSSS